VTIATDVQLTKVLSVALCDFQTFFDNLCEDAAIQAINQGLECGSVSISVSCDDPAFP